MSSWASRAKDHFLQKTLTVAPITAEKPLLVVMGVASGHPCKKQQSDVYAVNGPAPPSRVLVEAALSLVGESDAGDDGAESHADHVDGSLHLEYEPATDADRWCWPHSTVMTGNELDLFTARLARFTSKGVIHGDAEALADKLVIRDRDGDDRALCLECTHLAGWRTSWRCGNWQRAGIANNARDSQLPVYLVIQFQRCDGFTAPTARASHD